MTDTCDSTYDAGAGLTLRCNGHHLHGNPWRGPAHQAPYAGLSWTWYDSEATRKAEQ